MTEPVSDEFAAVDKPRLLRLFCKAMANVRTWLDHPSRATNANVIGAALFLVAPDWIHGAPGGALIIIAVVLMFRRRRES